VQYILLLCFSLTLLRVFPYKAGVIVSLQQANNCKNAVNLLLIPVTQGDI